jgi:aminoglycoside phosphotransferase (APT) family kinase protein
MPEGSTDIDLPEVAQRFCIESVRGARSIRRIERLRGGLAAVTHLVELDRGEDTLEVVLRRFVRKGGAGWPPIAQEIAALETLQSHLSSAAFSVPRVIALDSGTRCDVPAMLLSRVAGHIELSRRVAGDLVPELARALAALHAAPIACPSIVEEFVMMPKKRDRPVPPGIIAPDWSRVWPLLDEIRFENDSLIHHDFHMGNALFSDASLTGIVDWSLVRRGPRLFDVGYCRVDLSMLFGMEEADLFLAAYEAATGTKVPQLALWDLAGAVRAYPDPEMWLPGWIDAGRTDLTADLIRDRLRIFVERALSRL